MDCITDRYVNWWRAQFVMSRYCCMCCTAKPCWWCWRPAACELPVSYPARQPATPQMPRWPTATWCTAVLSQVEPKSVDSTTETYAHCWCRRCCQQSAALLEMSLFSCKTTLRLTALVELLLLRRETPQLISRDMWPANSPYMNPVDYHIWGIMQEHVYRAPVWDVGKLRQRLVGTWAEFQQSVADQAW